jgi:hypothetical protein
MAESTNTSDESSKKKANAGAEKPAENKVSTTQAKNVSPTQETHNMETHAHHLHHAPGKKFWHYFYEFLMLFLAVFCGFLAENQREHMVEHQREKQYMKSMLDDLKLDTAEINRTKSLINNYLNPVFKKSIALLYLEHFSDSTIKEMYDTVPKSTRFLTIAFQNNTITQLKNSGNLRLIRNKEVTDSLVKYWNECDYLINTQLASYEAVRTKSKELIFSLFNLNYFENNSLTNPLRKNISLKLMSEDRVQFITLANYLSNSHTQLNTQLTGSIFHRLNTINRKATDLITLIQRKYHLE